MSSVARPHSSPTRTIRTHEGGPHLSLPSDELLQILALTAQVTLGATLLGSLLGIPLGTFLGLSRLRGRGLVRAVVYSLYALPPVVAGLVLYLLLRREGPLGGLELLFTPWAILLAETLLTIPLITGLTIAAIAELPSELAEAIDAGGPTPHQRFLAFVSQARFGILSAVLVGYGRSLAEVAAALIVGGNIRGETRTLGTAILQEVNQGEFGFALALAAILLAQAAATAFLLYRLQRAERVSAGRPVARRGRRDGGRDP
jgi:tungstate transport system permease protein